MGGVKAEAKAQPPHGTRPRCPEEIVHDSRRAPWNSPSLDLQVCETPSRHVKLSNPLPPTNDPGFEEVSSPSEKRPSSELRNM